MLVNHAAENALGTIGTVLWTCQIIPQIWKSWREKSTEGLSPWLMFIWAVSGIFLGVYVIVQNINIPLILQPQLFTVLAVVSWMQCLYYGPRKRSITFCVAVFLGFLIAFAGLEVGLSIVIKRVTENGNDRPLQFFGIFSAVLISLALIPQYVEIVVRREVIGISIPFLAIDFAGAIFCMLSLAFKPNFDAIAAATYLAVMVQDSVIILAALVLNPLARRRRRQRAATEPTVPERSGSGTDISSPVSSSTNTLHDDKPVMTDSRPTSEIISKKDVEAGICR